MAERNPDRRVEIYQDKAGDWRWRVWALRGNLPDEKLADSAEGYRKLSHAREMARSLFPGYWVEDPRDGLVEPDEGK